ncbi:MAG: DEAD/DEAH box helicase [Desulfurococcaceae archaeon]
MKLNEIAQCLKELGYQQLTEVQVKSLAEITRGDHSLIIIAPTGSGKTEAAVLPVMLKATSEGKRPIVGIYITPLRALNRDIERRLKRIGKCFNLDIGVRHGDTPASIRRAISKEPPHILITTPETFNYILLNEEVRQHLKNLEYIIVDEYRDLIESKRGLLLFTSIYLLEALLKKSPIKIGLTATIQDERVALEILTPREGESSVVLRDQDQRKLELQIVVPECKSELCRKIAELVDDERLSARLAEIFSKAIDYKYVLLFTNTRTLVESLGSLLKKISKELGLNISLEVHHGSLSRQHREDVEREFKERGLNMLVATSSLELGIDIGHVEYVIQYMSPRQATRLVQRVGRSRHRLGDVSKGVIIATNNALHLLECCVLAQRAQRGLIERETVIYKPLDVLAYTVALFVALNSSGVPITELYSMISRHPLYRGISREEFQDVVNYLAYTHVVQVRENVLLPTRKTRLYLYRTSMIPSSRDVIVIEAGSNRKVGALDEEYVVINVNAGDVIVLAGSPWRVISYDEKEAKLYVERAKVMPDEVIIPHWEGENIPVDYSTAQEVGRAVRAIKETGDLPADFKSMLSVPATTSNDLLALRGLGDDKNIYVDAIKNHGLIIINVYGGNKVNAILRDIVKYNVKSKYPFVKLNAYSSPYAIALQLEDRVAAGSLEGDIHRTVYTAIKEIRKYANQTYIERVAKESSLYLWRIYQVAQRFGAISPETTKVTKRLLEAFTETVIGKEALKEVLVKDYDIDYFADLANRVAEGEVRVEQRVYSELGEHHTALLGYIELPLVKELGSANISDFFERLLSRKANLLCLKCGYHKSDRVRELMKIEKFSCPKCGFATLTLVKGDVEKELELVRKLIRGGKLSAEEQRLRDDLAERAVLLYRYGQKALLALSVRGVGTQEAVRVINNVSRGKDLLAELYDCEKRFLKIKKYLDRNKGEK